MVLRFMRDDRMTFFGSGATDGLDRWRNLRQQDVSSRPHEAVGKIKLIRDPTCRGRSREELGEWQQERNDGAMACRCHRSDRGRPDNVMLGSSGYKNRSRT